MTVPLEFLFLLPDEAQMTAGVALRFKVRSELKFILNRGVFRWEAELENMQLHKSTRKDHTEHLASRMVA
jgi:hypothetical protein